MNATQRRRMMDGLSRHMKAVANARRCPKCERKMALEKLELADGWALKCRWDGCGYARGMVSGVRFEEGL